MISEVVMPQMGADMTEGTIVRWRKQEGEPVERGEIIAEIETDKANVEIEAFEGGVFRKILAHEGAVIPVGGIIAVIAAPGDDISTYEAGASAPVARPAAPRAATSSPPSISVAAPTAAVVAAPDPDAAAAANGRLRVSPVARRLADERGIDLRQLRGSGPDGRIVKRDIERTATTRTAAAPTAAAPDAVAPAAERGGTLAMSKMRQAIARRMATSKREAPHYYLLVDVDMTAALAFRAQANATLPDDARVSINDMIVRACALALRAHPAFNVTADSETFTQQTRQNVCIAIALDDGLIAPAVLDAGAKTLAQIARETKDLVARAKGGALRAEEITAGTFSITNLGAYGIETLIGIIQPPQTAILGVGSVTAQPAARDGQIVVRDLMKVALSADHRVTDGALGAQFLAEIKRLLEAPLLLVL
ncbi:MAG TPA: dihydrolipoamide acetyltransferase family protein [Dehalococcoidia bacterium]|nr:dihydrolipoamide acetyltransferase family protein [Dehalococcoidia bacterium]